MLALGCGLVASIGITEVMAKRNAEPAGLPGETRSIFVAVTDIGLGDLLTPQVLKLEQWPKDKIPAGAISKIEDLEGRRTRARLYAGEPILENRLLAKGATQQGATALIPKGYRVVPVRVDMVSGGSSLILPGDRVDVMVHLVRDPGRDIQETVTRTILQDIKVFAVNEVVDLEKEKDGGTKTIAAKTISLLLTPDQAAKVTLASQMGNLNLVMRGPDDDQQIPNTQAKPSELFSANTKAERGKELTPPAGPEPSLTDKTKSFMEFLGSLKQKSAAGESTMPETWSMRLLKPGSVDEVQFQAEAAKGGASAGNWKSTTMAGLSSAAGETPKVAEPPAAHEPPPMTPPLAKDKDNAPH
jgi:pilus assembly protein CpaB